MFSRILPLKHQLPTRLTHTWRFVLVVMLLLGAGFVTSGCAVIEGSGKPVEVLERLEKVSKLDVHSSFRVTVKRGDSAELKITIDHNLRAFLDIYVKGDTLHLGLAQGAHYKNFNASATITVPALKELRLSGAAQVTLGGIPCDGDLEVKASGASQLLWEDALRLSSLSISASGASRVTFGSLTIDGETDVKASGASRVSLKGTGQELKLNLSGASRANMIEFALDIADAKLSGASHAELQVVKRIEGNLSGASSITLLGKPIQDVSASGASRVKAYESGD